MNSESEWNNYLRKYKDKFVVKKAEDNIYNILCYKGNFIFLYSLNSKILGFMSLSGKSMKRKNIVIDFFKKKSLWFQIFQEGDCEFIILFKEEDLEKVKDDLKVRRKAQLSEEERQRRSEHLKKVRKEVFKDE